MYIYIYIHTRNVNTSICLLLSLSLSLYMHVCTRETTFFLTVASCAIRLLGGAVHARVLGHPSPAAVSRRGTNGVSTNGVTAIFMLFDRGTFWVLPLTYFYLPQSARTYFSFYQSVKNRYFRSGPISVDPICPQPKAHTHRHTSYVKTRYFCSGPIRVDPVCPQPSQVRQSPRRHFSTDYNVM